jgi:hypothetical protein
MNSSIIIVLMILELSGIAINAVYTYGKWMALIVDTAILRAIISAAVSFGIFGLKEKLIEPRRWKKKYRSCQT